MCAWIRKLGIVAKGGHKGRPDNRFKRLISRY
jgi:hypothetical protein